MTQAHQLSAKTFEYASYVIMSGDPRSGGRLQTGSTTNIHTLRDGWTSTTRSPIQRKCDALHPHGDVIYEAPELANNDLFIDRQGNLETSHRRQRRCPRYIECRLLPFAKEVLQPRVDGGVESYDGRNKEPVVFPPRFPSSHS